MSAIDLPVCPTEWHVPSALSADFNAGSIARYAHATRYWDAHTVVSAAEKCWLNCVSGRLNRDQYAIEAVEYLLRWTHAAVSS